MFKRFAVIAFVAALGASGAAQAETLETQNGDDTFIAAEQLRETLATGGDTFVAARTLQTQGAVNGDLHVAGFDVSVLTDTNEDLYAAGATVVLRGAIASDLTAAAFTLRTEQTAVTQGNARLVGNSITVDGAVLGALSILGRDVILNAPIDGDVRITAQSLTFGPDAQVSGTLTYSSDDEITVPARVAAPERVVYEPVSFQDAWDDWDDIAMEMPVLPTFASLVFGFMVSLLFFLALGALALAFMPKRLANMRKSIATAPGQTVILGIIGLSMLFGMIPIVALTVIGLPFVLIVVLAIVVAWTLGYALGAYSVAMRLWAGLGGSEDPAPMARLLVLAAAITFIALLNFIPFVGWVANYTLVLLGIGAMTRAIFLSMMGNPDVAFDVDMKPLDD